MKAIQIIKLVGATLLYLVTNVAVSYLVVAVYAYFINPGQPEQHYLDWAQLSAPYSSIIAGMPLMFLLGWWVSRWKSVTNPAAAMWVVWIAYVALDLGILTLRGSWSGRLLAFVTVSLATKLIAGQLGARFGIRKKPA